MIESRTKDGTLRVLCSGHRPGCLLRVPPTAAIKTHVLKDHHACLQVDRRFGSKAALASLATLQVSCPL